MWALVVSVLSGILLAGLAFPLVGGLGLAAKAGAEQFTTLPSDLDTPELSNRSVVLASDGSVLATFYSVNRVSVPMSQIPQELRDAVVAIEDSRFYQHKGVDYKGTLRAALTNLKSGGVAQGGSTLTQQYVKNALLEAAKGDEAAEEAARGISIDRKLREARYALALERKLSKAEILHRYLDIAYFGNGVYGVGTAATYYFGKPVSKLTLPESALLAGVVQNPARNPASSSNAVRRAVVDRRNVVLSRMQDLGYITPAARRKAAATRLPKIKPTKVGQDCGATTVKAPFFCDYVRHELQDTEVGAALGATPKERITKLFGGGLTIRTTLDPAIQKAAQQAVDTAVPSKDPSQVYAAIDMVEPGTGNIRAMALNRRYGERDKKGQTQVNYPDGGIFGGFQPGSTFKPFFLAAALEEGLPLSTSFYSPATYTPDPALCTYTPKTSGEPYEVSNAEDDEAGTFDMRTGTHASVNTYYVQLAEKIGLEKPLALAESLGLKLVESGKESALPRVCSAVLGTPTVNPLAMAGAYATFAAHGKHCTPRAVVGIETADGKKLDVPPTKCKQAMEANIADTVTSVLEGVVGGNDPHRTGRGAAPTDGRPAAGKTGTTNDSRAAWFVGYTPQLASAVVLTKKNPTPLSAITINGNYYTQVYGGTIPADIFSAATTAALAGKPVEPFTAAAPIVGQDQPVGQGVPDIAGLNYDEAFAVLRAAGLSPTAGRHESSSLPAELVTRTFPGAGTPASPGALVYVYRSLGAGYAAPAPRTQRPYVAPSTPGTTRPTRAPGAIPSTTTR